MGLGKGGCPHAHEEALEEVLRGDYSCPKASYRKTFDRAVPLAGHKNGVDLA
jgi:hypothetical protein